MSIFSHHSPRSFKAHPGKPERSRGFTLIELVVVISIMVIVTSIILLNQSRFDSSTVLRSLAYSVALSVRQAQVYGGSVFGTSTPSGACVGGSFNSTTCYAAAYGVHFSVNSATYVLFADLNNDGRYEPSEAIKTFTFSSGYQIYDLCATAGTQTCNSTSGTISPIDIVFHRPNPEACFGYATNPTACGPGGTPNITQVQIKLQAGSDITNTRSVIVTNTGEIEVCANAPGSGGSGC